MSETHIQPDDGPQRADTVMTVSADGTAHAPDHTDAAEGAAAAADGRNPAASLPTDEPAAAAAAAAPATGAAMSDSKNDSPQQTPAAVAPVVIKQSSGKGVALGALVLSLLALGASGFLFVQGQNLLKNQELSFDQKIGEAGLGQSKNAVLLENNQVRLTALAQQLAELQSRNRQYEAQLAESQRAYQELVRNRADWLVDEVEATLNLAAQQLLISGNVPVAVRVLEGLETRLNRFDHPQLLPIKQAVSQDIADLKNKPYLDTAGAALRLNRLETAVASLPMAVDSTLQAGESVPVAVDPQAPWWQRAWQNTVNSLKGMVEVRSLNSNDSMLMSPEQVYFVRENLRLRIMDARLALMQRSGEVYAAELNTAEAAVRQYFDPASEATRSWLNELAQLKSLDVHNTQDGNTLAASLNAVREYQQRARAEAVAALLPEAASAASGTPSAPAAAEASAPADASAASAAQQGGRAL